MSLCNYSDFFLPNVDFHEKKGLCLLSKVLTDDGHVLLLEVGMIERCFGRDLAPVLSRAVEGQVGQPDRYFVALLRQVVELCSDLKRRVRKNYCRALCERQF